MPPIQMADVQDFSSTHRAKCEGNGGGGEPQEISYATHSESPETSL